MIHPAMETIDEALVTLVHQSTKVRSDIVHNHSWNELILVDQGAYQTRFGGSFHALRPGQAICYPAGCEHLPSHPDPVTRLWLVQWRGWMPEWRTPVIVDDVDRRVLFSMSWMHDRQSIATGSFVKDVLRSILTEIDLIHRHKALATEPIERARMLLQGALHRAISQPLLAKAVGLTPSHLCRAFAKVHEETPIAYLTRLRLETALILGQDGQLPLSSIAGRVGYSSAAALRHALKRAGHHLNFKRRRQLGRNA